ncbi:hypothetical protein PR048_010858 [Dryococelus australis]|uniref:Uncharacterized protein n=1 Tax=Dryococelus australis TaxID=614101 RepID=A0ABQ9I3Y9_9NEOP|nr:hypothetical protein PR048_010858 [Dryococelus australis]
MSATTTKQSYYSKISNITENVYMKSNFPNCVGADGKHMRRGSIWQRRAFNNFFEIVFLINNCFKKNVIFNPQNVCRILLLTHSLLSWLVMKLSGFTQIFFAPTHARGFLITDYLDVMCI